GYQRERAAKLWELDLSQHGARLVAEAKAAREQMDGGGIRLLTVAEWRDGDKLRKLYELNERTVQDVPHSLPIVTEAFEDFETLGYVRRPGWVEHHKRVKTSSA